MANTNAQKTMFIKDYKLKVKYQIEFPIWLKQEQKKNKKRKKMQIPMIKNILNLNLHTWLTQSQQYIKRQQN